MYRMLRSNYDSCKRHNKTYSPWSDLPTEILYLFLDLLGFADRIRFGSVCSSWKSATDNGYRQTKPWDCPWVICSRSTTADDSVFFSIDENKIYDLKLHVDERATCCGSSKGWVMMAHRLTRKFLVNPITQHKIRLPPQDILPVQKVAVSSSTPSNSTKIAVLHGNNNKSSACWPGEKSWTLEREVQYGDDSYHDFVFLDNGTLRYLFGNELTVMFDGRGFIVKSNGKLLVIKLWQKLRLRMFEQEYEGSSKWISNLGDRTLFISSGCSESVVVNDQSVFRRNSIYYIDPELTGLHLISLDDLSSTRVDLGELIPRMWFFPSG